MGKDITRGIAVNDDHEMSTRTPEENLWWSVLNLLVRDIEDALRHVGRDVDKKGYASLYSHVELQHLLRLAKSSWVGEICSFVDLHHDTFVRGCNRLVSKAGLEFYEVEQQDQSFTFVGEAVLRTKRGT